MFVPPSGWVLYKIEEIKKGMEMDYPAPDGELPKIGYKVATLVKEAPVERTAGGKTALRHQVDSIWLDGDRVVKRFTEAFWGTTLFVKNIPVPAKPKFGIGWAVVIGFIGFLLLRRVL